MCKKNFLILLAVSSSLLFVAPNVFAYRDIGNSINTVCAQSGNGSQPFTGDCSLCHVSDRSEPTPAKEAALGSTADIVAYFCPLPTCTDNDGDGFATQGGSCGPVDCNDNNAAVKPGAAENCTDGIDNNCNGLIDGQDPAAVGCPPVCTDADGDTYAVEGGACGPVDCDDSDASINPGAAEVCGDSIDNNCNGATDEDCGPVCTDADGDTYAAEGGACGPADCDDSDASINPGAAEVCGDSIDNNCNSAVDENCGPACTDNDGDTYAVEGGDCGPVDCDDANAAVNPAATENCTDGVDNNCNGLVDSLDPNATGCPPVCTDNDSDGYSVEGGACGPVDCDDNDASVNPGTAEFCGDAIDNNCDGQTDEGCDTSCPDVDGDGYMDTACGGTDCDDNDGAINPGAQEVCGNGIDENCNGASDDICVSNPPPAGDDDDHEYDRDDDDDHDREYHRRDRRKHESSSDGWRRARRSHD